MAVKQVHYGEISHVLSAGRTDPRLPRGDAFSVFQSQHEKKMAKS